MVADPRLCWKLWLGAFSVGFFFFFSFLPVMLPSEIPKLPTDPLVTEFPAVWKTSPSQLPPQGGSPSLTLLSLFLSYIFFLPPFEENGFPFWVPGVLCQRSEVVLWKWFSIQMIF